MNQFGNSCYPWQMRKWIFTLPLVFVWPLVDGCSSTDGNKTSGASSTGSSSSSSSSGSESSSSSSSSGSSGAPDAGADSGEPPFMPTDCTVWFEVGDDWQKVADGHGPGTRYCVRKGVHRMQTIAMKDGDSLVGELGAIMTGSRDLTPSAANVWAASGTDYCISGQTIPARVYMWDAREMNADPDVPHRDNYPEELFVKGSRFRHVDKAARGVLRSDEWYFDYTNQKVCLGIDPATIGCTDDRCIEVSISTSAINAAGGNACEETPNCERRSKSVLIENMVIERYATGWRTAAIGGWFQSLGEDWTVRRNEIRDIHDTAVAVGAKWLVENNDIHHNGAMSLHGEAMANRIINGMPFQKFNQPAIVRNNDVHQNMVLDVHWQNEGSIKFDGYSITVENNWFHDNRGPGLWCDVSCQEMLYTRNKVEKNWGPGIFYEISWNGEISYNIVQNNGQDPDILAIEAMGKYPGFVGQGIYISASHDTNVHHNYVGGNQHDIHINASGDANGPRTSSNCTRDATGYVTCSGNVAVPATNNHVHDNVIRPVRRESKLSESGVQPADYCDTNSMPPVGGTRFDNNQWILSQATQTMFAWNNGFTGCTALGAMTSDKWTTLLGFDTQPNAFVVDPTGAAFAPPTTAEYFQESPVGPR